MTGLKLVEFSKASYFGLPSIPHSSQEQEVWTEYSTALIFSNL